MHWGRDVVVTLLLTLRPSLSFRRSYLGRCGPPRCTSSSVSFTWQRPCCPQPEDDHDFEIGAAETQQSTGRQERSTRYTIDVDLHPDVEMVALKHARQLERFLECYPISAHTREAYGEAMKFVREFYLRPRLSNEGDAQTIDVIEKSEGIRVRDGAIKSPDFQYHPERPRYRVVLDSGCGTGRSTASLARSYPHLPVLGIDRSAVRLSKGGDAWTSREEWQESRRDRYFVPGGVGDSSTRKMNGKFEHGVRNATSPGENMSGVKMHMQVRHGNGDDHREKLANETRGSRLERHGSDVSPPNLLLLRADLVDFWILASRDDEWIVEKHFILYPNPYPKRSQLRSRWHGHPVFPVIMSLRGDIIVRSNWRTYLEEVCLAVLSISDGEEQEITATKASHNVKGDDASNSTHVCSAAEATPSRGYRESSPSTSRGQRQSRGADEHEHGQLESVDAADGIMAISKVVAEAAAAYAACARRGPSEYTPSLPISNFEAKYKAAGEKLYELRLKSTEAVKD